MIDTDKYEGHTEGPWKTGGYNEQAIKIWTVSGFDETENWLQVPRADRLLAVDAPLLLAEVKRLQKEVDLLSIDVCESLELILDAHHPEVKNSVMSMFGDAIGDNWPYYGTPLPNKEMIE